MRRTPMRRTLRAALAAALVPSIALAPAFAQVTAEQRVFREVVTVTPEGEREVTEVPAARVAPGDRVIYRLVYRNEGKAPASGLVLNMPVPEGIVLDPASVEGPGRVAYSVDGETYGAPESLSVGDRPAAPADLRHVRWTLTDTLAPGATGSVAYRGVLR